MASMGATNVPWGNMVPGFGLSCEESCLIRTWNLLCVFKPSHSGLLCTSQILPKCLFLKSKAQLGVLGPVERARVGQLQSDDVDRPLSPGARATCLNFPKVDVIVFG